ncbi:hypothetical protein [Bosea vaviloviae]|nr:hypothetical protein [Bosea vaviloviae]
MNLRHREDLWRSLGTMAICAWLIYRMFKSSEPWGLFRIAAVALALYLLFYTVRTLAGAFNNSVKLSFDRDGIFVAALSERRIPWAAIESYSLPPPEDDRPILSIKIADPEALGIMRRNPIAMWAGKRWGFRIPFDRIACDSNDLALGFWRFAPWIPRCAPLRRLW